MHGRRLRYSVGNIPVLSQKKRLCNRVFSCDVIAAMLVLPNNKVLLVPVSAAPSCLRSSAGSFPEQRLVIGLAPFRPVGIPPKPKNRIFQTQKPKIQSKKYDQLLL